MACEEALEELERAASEAAYPDVLPDLIGVRISGGTSAERLDSFLDQVGNPYRFQVGKTPVRLSFSADGAALEEKLRRYFLSLKQNGSGGAVRR